MQEGDFDEASAKREKQRARELRNSQWWKNKIANAECYYCHKKLLPREATMDHIVPISRGGSSVKGNVVVACKQCNTSKKDQVAVEWEVFERPKK